MIQTICVAGAGTMGCGIALVAAQNSFPVILFDIDGTVLERSASVLQNNLRHLVEKQKITVSESEAIINNIQFTSDASACLADLFIEAIVENAVAKIGLFNQFAAHNDANAIFATNTSSLSVSDIQAGIAHPERIVGMHFFNPAPVMKLVEIIKGQQTDDATAETVYQLCKAMGKTPVYCDDKPGFIVNRIARHYYLEAMKIAETGVAGIEDIDALMEASGFKMGPFKLMDLIGMDINLTVTERIYEAFNYAERFAPAGLQKEKVAKGELGKKTGKGFYGYPS